MMPGGRAWRWLALPAVVIFAVLAVGSGLDRSAGDVTGAEKWILNPLRSGVHFVQARSFAEVGIPGSAMDPARQALRSDPANPAAPALVGMAMLGKRDFAGADRAFRVAARLGWREPLTQLYWFQASLAQNDLTNAVLRFDAIARQFPDAPYVRAMADSLEQSDAGRDALARRIAAGANWTQSYATIREGTTGPQIAARVDVLERVGALGAQIGCEGLVQTMRVLAVVDPPAGSRLWRKHCPRAAGQSLVIDDGFEQPALASPEEQIPFEWAFTGHGGLDASLTPVKGGQALQVRSTSSVTLPFIEQLVPLAPGEYRLSWWMENGEGLAAQRLFASLSCERDLLSARPGPGVRQGARLVRQFRIPAGCSSPWLRLWLAPGTEAVMIDDLRIDPV